MKFLINIFSVLVILFSAISGCADSKSKTNSSSASNEELKVSSFCESLTGVGRILEDSLWTNWDMAPMYDEDGTLHLFVGRWKKGTSWLKEAEIVHYKAASPEGPYEFVETIFQDDTTSFYNPQIKKAGDKYVLVYSYRGESWPNLIQQVGLATSKSLDGPWKESPNNPIISPSFVPGSANCLHASNATFVVDKEGKYRIYYKSISDQPDDPHLRTISMAYADNIEGPYENYDSNPVISYTEHGLDVEDPYVFLYNDKYYILLEDRRGVGDLLSGKEINLNNIHDGGVRPALLYSSDDGYKWDRPEIGCRTNSYYFGEDLKRMERPHILWKDGKPEYLFMALEKGKYGLGTGAVLKVGEEGVFSDQ